MCWQRPEKTQATCFVQHNHPKCRRAHLSNQRSSPGYVARFIAIDSVDSLKLACCFFLHPFHSLKCLKCSPDKTITTALWKRQSAIRYTHKNRNTIQKKKNKMLVAREFEVQPIKYHDLFHRQFLVRLAR